MKRILWILLSLIVLSVPIVIFYYSKLSILKQVNFYNIINEIFNYVSVFIIVSIIFLVIRENSNPIKTIAWIQILIFLPIVGFILYIFFGINYRKRKIFKMKSRTDEISIDSFLQTLIPYHNKRLTLKEQKDPLSSRLITLMQHNDKAFLSWHNKIDIFFSGKDKINQLFLDISRAKESIHLEYFSILYDETGFLLKELLIDRLKAGVEIRIIYDSVGSWRIRHHYWEEIIKAGGECYPFLPVYFPFLSSKLNYRDHRKIVIIDNQIGYIGGVNIGNKYMGMSKKFGNWRDSHLKIEGEAVLLLQKIFLLDWSFVSNKSLFIDKYFITHSTNDYLPMQIVTSGPDSDWENILQVYFTMISSAQKYIYIQTPYMVLDESILMALKTASLSGIDIKIMLPEKPDHRLVYYGSRSYYSELISCGVKIYEYTKGFIHSKMILVDDQIVSIGTANMDLRSFKQNFEINALIYDLKPVLEVKKNYLNDLEDSHLIYEEDFKKRSFYLKILESLARLFSPIL